MSLVLDALAEHAQTRGGEIALSEGAAVLTYESLFELVEELAQKLCLRLPPWGTVAFCLNNGGAWVALDLALLRLARAALPLPTFFSEAQRHHALAQSGAAALITDRPASGHRCVDILSFCGRDIYLYVLDAAPVELPKHTAKITYTSGTSGAPKGVCLAQSALEQVARSLVDTIGDEFAGMHCAVLPLAVLLENVAGLYPTLIAGGHYHVPPPKELGFENPFMPDFFAMAEVLRARDITSTILVPELLRGLMAALAASQTNLPAMKLIAVGGAKVAPALLETAAQLGLPVFQGYGLSEAASVVAFNTPHDNRDGSVGKPLPHVRLELAEDGEVMIANPGFLGYVGAPGAPEILKTGDIGAFDEDGSLFIEGRKSNILITAFGRNVAPEWVESELLAEREIGQAMVFGDGEPALGALIVPSSQSITPDDLARAIARANGRLPGYARVLHWSMAMPFTPANNQLTANGRLRRAEIAEAYRETMDACIKTKGQHVTFFERLFAETVAQRAYLQETPQIRETFQGRISREAYLDYLAQAYYHVKHTVPLMGLVYDRLPDDKAWLRAVLEHYISEETGHEQWILDDIAAAGGDPDRVRDGAPRIATEVMVSYAYDFITRVNPVGFFGMVFVLEGTSTELAARGAHALMETLGLPETCFRYLLSHGALDVGHIQFLKSLLDRIEDPDDQAAVIHMAQVMFVLFSNIFRAIPYGEASHVAA